MSTRLWVAALIYPMVQAVAFGLGLLAILSIPTGISHSILLPVMIAVSAAVSAPVAWVIAPKMMLRYQRR